MAHPSPLRTHHQGDRLPSSSTCHRGLRQRSQPPLEEAQRDLPLYHPVRPQDLASPTHWPLGLCWQNSDTGARVTQPGQTPRPGPGADRCSLPSPAARPQHWLGEEGYNGPHSPEKRRATGEGGRGTHLPKSVQLETQSSLRIHTVAAVSLSFE